MPDDLKAVIDANSGIEWAARFGAVNDADDVIARDAALAAGNAIVVLDAEEAARWRAAAQVTIENWFTEAEAAGIDGQGLHARAVELVAEEGGS